MHGRKRDLNNGQPGFITVPLLAHRDRDASWTPSVMPQHPNMHTRWQNGPALERRAQSGPRARPPIGAAGLAVGRQRDKFVALPEEADDTTLPLIEEPAEVVPAVPDTEGMHMLGALTAATLPAPGIFEDLPRPIEPAWRGRIT